MKSLKFPLTIIDKIWLAAPAIAGLAFLLGQLVLHGSDLVIIGALALFWGLAASTFSIWFFGRTKTRVTSYAVTALVALACYGLVWVSLGLVFHFTRFDL